MAPVSRSLQDGMPGTTDSPSRALVLEVYAGVVSRLNVQVWIFLWRYPRFFPAHLVLSRIVLQRHERILAELIRLLEHRV